MKTSKSHSRGDHLMERLHGAKHSFFGSWRCRPCAGDFVSPVPRAQKYRERKKSRKDLNDPNFDPNFVKSSQKVPEKEDRKDTKFDPYFVKSSHKVPAEEDRKDPNFTRGSQPTVAKKDRKDRSLRSLMHDSQQPKPREDHLLLENQSWRKEGDTEENRKEDSQSHRGMINEQLQPTPLKDANELMSQDEKNLEGKDAAVPSPTDKLETESLKHSEPVNNTTIPDEATIKETHRQDSQSQRGKVNGEVRSKSQEDRHELESPNEDMGNLEEKDAVPSHPGLAKSQSLEQPEQVNDSSVSDEAVGKENEQKEDSKSQRGKVNGEVQLKSQGDRHELESPNEDMGNLEEKDAVPSHPGLAKSQSLEQPEQVNDSSVSDEAVGKENEQKEDSQSQRGKVNGEVRSKSQGDRHELESPNEDMGNLEEKDAVPSHPGLAKSQSLEQPEQVNDSSVSDEAVGKENEQKEDSQSQRGKVNGEVRSKSQGDRHELESPNEDMGNLEEKDAVPSHPGLAKSQSLEQPEQVNDSSVSDEAVGKENEQKEDSQSQRGKVNGEVRSKSQGDRHELESPNEDMGNLEEKDAVPSHPGLAKSQSLEQPEQVNDSSVSDEAVGKENEQKEDSQSQRGKVNGEVQLKSQGDRHELESPNEDMGNLEEKDAVPSHPGLAKSQSLEQPEQVNDSSVSDEAVGKENEQKEDSQSQRGKVNGEVRSKSQGDRHELESPNEDMGNLEEKDAVPSHPGLAKSQSLEQPEQVNDSSVSDEAVGKENEQKEDSQSQRGKVNGEVQLKSQGDRHELESPNEDMGNLEEKDAVPSHPGLAKSQSLEQAKQVNDSSISEEAVGKENEQKEDSQSQRGKVNGEVRSKSQEDRHELESANEDMGNLEEKDAVPSHPGLAKSQSLEQPEQVNDSSVSDEVVGKENEQKEDSPSQRAKMNGQLPATSQPDGHEHKGPEENVGKSEETDAVPSYNSLPITEFLEHLEPDSKATVSDEGTRDGDMVPPDDSQSQLSQSSQTGTRSAMQSAPKKAYQHAKHLKAEILEELDPGHNTTAAHVGAQDEVEHLGSPPPEYLKQFSQTSGGEEGGKSIDMLIQYWEEKRQHHPEDVVPEGKFQRGGSQKLEIPKEFNKADSTRLSRPGSQSGAEHLESPHKQGILSKQSSDIAAAGQNTDIPHSESYESPQEAEGENITPAGFNGLQQTQNEIFGASGFREAEQEWDNPELDGDGLHSARDEKLGALEEADPNHSLNAFTDQDSQHKRQASQSVEDLNKGIITRPSNASSEDGSQHKEGTSPGEAKYALNSVRHQEMEGKKMQDDLHDKQTQNGDQEDHYTRNTGLLPLNLEDLHRAKATKFSNAGSGDRFEHRDDPYPDHEKGEMMQDDFIEKQIHGGAEDPEECFPNSANLEEFLTRNGFKKGASNSAHGDGSSMSSSHDQGKAGSTCLWDRVSTHDIGEDKTGHLYRDHSHHIGHSHRAEHSHHTGLPHQTDHGEAAAQSEETSAWKLGFFSVPHIVVVGALTALSVLGKAAN